MSKGKKHLPVSRKKTYANIGLIGKAKCQQTGNRGKHSKGMGWRAGDEEGRLLSEENGSNDQEEQG